MLVKFMSNDLLTVISATVIEKRKYTVKLQLEDGTIIVKKYKQLLEV